MSSYTCDAEQSLLAVNTETLAPPVLSLLLLLLLLLLLEERDYMEKG